MPRRRTGAPKVDVALGDGFISGEGGQFNGSIYNVGFGVEPGRMAADKGPRAAGFDAFARDQFGNGISSKNPRYKCHRLDAAVINQVGPANGHRPINHRFVYQFGPSLLAGSSERQTLKVRCGRSGPHKVAVSR